MLVSVMPMRRHASRRLSAMMKNHGPSGEPWMGGLDGGVRGLLVGRQLHEVALGGRRQRLDHVLERVAVRATMEVGDLRRDLGVRSAAAAGRAR
ncbi:MAG: hypothetical protein U0470_13400 [Anaerolineae bacterium]